MATYAARAPWALRVRALTRARTGTLLAIGGLVALSVLLRTQRLDVGFWIDEGLSVGIADRPFTDIFGTLRLDGSPPLYYLLLHLWMGVAGRGEEATHLLSVLIAIVTVPVTWALARALFGSRTGLIAAALAATNPFLTQYAQETRMYALVVLLGTVAVACFLGAFVFRRGRGWLVGFGAAVAALFYTHNWALFFAAGTGLAWLMLVAIERGPQRRAVLRDGLAGYGGAAVAFAPWVPTLLFQARHTGAPWALEPTVESLTTAPERLLGGEALVALGLAAGAGLVALVGGRSVRRLPPEGRSVLALAVITVATIVLAWAASQANPAWAVRYLAVALPPLLALAAVGLGAAGRLGLAGTVLVCALWIGDDPPPEKSNVREVAAAVAPALAPGDLVISTQPEQAPVLAYYLERDAPSGLRYATLTGPLADLGVTDWRDGEERLSETSPQRDLVPLLDRVPEGGRVVVLEPQIYDIARWSAPWTSLVRLRSAQWLDWMQQDARFRVVTEKPAAVGGIRPNPVRATVFIRQQLR